MSYLTNKPGSLEEIVKGMTKNINDSAYQDMFKKELEKAGKGVGAMSSVEKTAFFNKLDKMHKAKNETTKESLDETHMSLKKVQNQSQLDKGGEKEVVKPISVKETILKMWQEATASQAADETPEEKKESEQLAKKKVADTGSKATEVETEPKINYNK